VRYVVRHATYYWPHNVPHPALYVAREERSGLARNFSVHQPFLSLSRETDPVQAFSFFIDKKDSGIPYELACEKDAERCSEGNIIMMLIL
jgi:hypothetical protein